jgi:hypothetical protein
VCKWGVAFDKRCRGHVAACGPWNGRCPVREAFLEAHGLPEPRYPGDLAGLLQILSESFDDDTMRRTRPAETVREAPSATLAETRSPAEPASEGPINRADDIVRRMKKYKREHPGRDFGRRLRR